MSLKRNSKSYLKTISIAIFLLCTIISGYYVGFQDTEHDITNKDNLKITNFLLYRIFY